MISQAINLTKLQTAVCARREGSFFRRLFLPLFLSIDCTLTPLNIPNVDDLVLGKVVASNVGHDWRWGRRRWRLSVGVLVRLFGCLLWRRLDGVGLVFKLKTTLKTSVVPSRFRKSTTLLIAQVAWTSPAWNATKEFQSQSISIIWVPFLCIVWSKYLQRLGMLLYILSRLGSICRGLACYCSYSISYHALAASAEAWHAFLSYHALAVSAEAWHSTR